jgi:transcriptional regulator with XRE-family HTH domain
MVEQLVINVGRKIRELRGQRGLTLRQLSAQADVSPSSIQKIERNLISPTLGTVLRIARGLGVGIESLLNAHPETREVVYLPKEKRGTIAVPDLRITLQCLAEGLPDQAFSAVILTIPRGAKMKEREFQHHGEELMYCLKGTVEFAIGDQQYLLTAGDSLRFKSNLRHFWRHVGEEEAQLLMICAPPIYVGRSPDEG